MRQKTLLDKKVLFQNFFQVLDKKCMVEKDSSNEL
jgi:hypothetical protein